MKYKSTYGKKGSLVVGFLLAIAGMLWVTVANANAALMMSVPATLPNTEIRLSISRDGSEPFSDADPLDDGTGAHTPGLDLNANNNVVRTNDTIQYRIDWNVNEVAGTNTVLEVTLPDTGSLGGALDLTWISDPAYPFPAGCLTTGVTPPTALSNGDRTLTCNVGDHAEGTSGTIFAIAELGGGRLDGDAIELDATIDTDQSDPAVSEMVSTTISSAPAGNWLKGYDPVSAGAPRTPDEYEGVIRNGVEGRVYIWPLYFKLGAETSRGAEPLDDSVAITFYDHMWSAPSAFLISDADASDTALFPNYATIVGRQGCGGFDGAANLPFGRSGLGTADNTDSGITLGTQTFNCTDATASAGNGYTTTELVVSGIDTDIIAPETSTGGINSGIAVTGQIAYWIAEQDLQVFGGGNPPPSIGSGIIENAISASTNAISTVPDDIDPIQVTGTTATVDENTTDDNFSAADFIWTNSSGNGGDDYSHMVKFFDGPYQERYIALDDGTELASFDWRFTSVGGLGQQIEVSHDSGSGVQWLGVDVVPRSKIVTIMAGVNTGESNSIDDPLHLCVGIDTRDLTLTNLPASFERHQTYAAGRGPYPHPTLSVTPGSPSDGPYAHLLIGSNAGDGDSRTFATGGDSLHVWTFDPPSYKIEFGYSQTYADQINNGLVPEFGLTCNNDDSPTEGWVEASTVADPSLYNMVRVVVTEPKSWTENVPPPFIDINGGTQTYGAGRSYGYFLMLQAQVGPDLNQQVSGDEIFVNASRARGLWDTVTENAPPNLRCLDESSHVFNDTIYPANPPDGWCNTPYDQSLDADGYDNQALEEEPVGNDRGFGDADTLTIVDARPYVEKANVDGLNDIANNGDLITFDIDFGITGSPQDTVLNTRITDALPGTFEFVSMTQPATTVEEAANPPDGTTNPLTLPACAHDAVTNTISCNFGRQAGGWSDSISITVRVFGATADSVLNNTAVISGRDANDTTDLVDRSSSAFAYMPGPQHELEVRKEVPDLDGTCINPPGVSVHVAGDCSIVPVNGTLVYNLYYTNTGNVNLENLTLIDVLPFNGDATEPQTNFYGNAGVPTAGAGTTGDGRIAPSAFSGTTSLATVVDNFGSAIQSTTDTNVDRNPETNTSVWAAGVDPAATAYRIDIPSLSPGQTGEITVTITTAGNVNDDIYTNNFGILAGGEPTVFRAPGDNGILVTNRSNDVSIMVRDFDLGAITGTVSADTDGDMVSDTALAGVVLELLDNNGNPVLDANGNPITTTTDANGAYLFDNVSPGDYLVIEQQPLGYGDQSEVDGGDDGDNPDNGVVNSIPVTVDPGETDTGNNFVEEIPGAITGTITEDTNGDGTGDVPIAGVVLELLDSAGNPVLDSNGNPITTTTDANGDYIFPDVSPGDYLVNEQQPAGYADVSEVDGGTDGDHPDNGVINNIPVTVDPGETDTGNDFVEELPGAITGTITEDTNGDGTGDVPIAGVVLELLDSAGNPVLDANGNPITTTTDANGDFIFPDVSPGDYTVVEQQPAGYNDVSEVEGGADGDNPDNGVLNSIDVTVDPGETDSGNDFVEEIPGAISGNVTADTDGDNIPDTPLPSVVLELLDDNGNPVLDGNGNPITTTTDANGDYLFPDVSPGDYTVVEQQPSGYNDQSEVDGGDDGDNPDNGVVNSIPVTVDPGETDTGNDFVEELQPTAVLVSQYGARAGPIQAILVVLVFIILIMLSRMVAIKQD